MAQLCTNTGYFFNTWSRLADQDGFYDTVCPHCGTSHDGGCSIDFPEVDTVVHFREEVRPMVAEWELDEDDVRTQVRNLLNWVQPDLEKAMASKGGVTVTYWKSGRIQHLMISCAEPIPLMVGGGLQAIAHNFLGGDATSVAFANDRKTMTLVRK